MEHVGAEAITFTRTMSKKIQPRRIRKNNAEKRREQRNPD